MKSSSLDYTKHNRNGGCGKLCVSGEIILHGKKAIGYARVNCKSWTCPKCGPRKAWRLIKSIETWTRDHDLSRFMTLTLDPKKIPNNLEREKYMRNVWSKFRVYLGRKLGKGVEYIAVMEYHKSGIPHLHVLINQFVPQKWISSSWSKLGGGYIADIKRVVDISKIGYYLGKYLTKDMILSAPKDSRRYTTSRGIKLNKHYVHTGQLDLFDHKGKTKWEIMGGEIEEYYVGAGNSIIAEEMDRDDGWIDFFAIPKPVEERTP